MSKPATQGDALGLPSELLLRSRMFSTLQDRPRAHAPGKLPLAIESGHDRSRPGKSDKGDVHDDKDAYERVTWRPSMNADTALVTFITAATGFSKGSYPDIPFKLGQLRRKGIYQLYIHLFR